MTRFAAPLAVAALALAWGYNWVAVKLATESATPFALAALRGAGGALALIVVMLATGRSLRPPPLMKTTWIGLFNVSAFILFANFALMTGGAGKVAVLVYTMPFWLAPLAAVYLKEPITPVRASALALGAVGLGFVLYPIDFGHGVVSKLFALAGAVAWAVASLLTKRWFPLGTVDMLVLTTWQLVIGAIPLVIAAFVVGGQHVHWSPTFGYTLAYTTLLGGALAFWLWFFIVSRLPATTAGLAALLNPVVSVLAAWLQLHERPNGTELIGIALILCALLLNSLGPALLSALRAPRVSPATRR